MYHFVQLFTATRVKTFLKPPLGAWGGNLEFTPPILAESFIVYVTMTSIVLEFRHYYVI